MKNEAEQTIIHEKPSRRKYIIEAGIILLLIILVLVFRLFQTEPKTDPANEYKIRWEASQFIGKLSNELTDEDFAKITKFRLGTPDNFIGRQSSVSQELSDIKLLEKFINLRQLKLVSIYYPSNAIPKWMIFLDKYGIYNIEERFKLDLEPIRKLDSLQKITIMLTPVENLKPLASLKNLQSLNLENIQVSNLEPLRNLVNLRELVLNGTSVSNLEPIKGLTNLITLSISDTPVSNLEPIKGLVNLRSLYAYNTPISDLKPILELKILLELHIDGCNNITDRQIEDLKKEMPHLKISYGNE